MANNKGLSFYRRKKKISASAFREFFSWVFVVLLAVFIAAVLTFFLGMSINVVGVSMEPTLYNEQQIFVNRFLYILSSPKQGDVVVFLPNGNENAHYYVKRVVAVPGDKIRVEDGVLYVNGLESEWCPEKIFNVGILENELEMGINEYFCIGDSPDNSEDSRSANIGPVHEEDIIGKAWFSVKGEQGSTGLIK